MVDCAESSEASAQALSEWESKAVPVVIPGAVKDWAACQKWSGKQGLEYISGKAGNANVKASCSIAHEPIVKQASVQSEI